MTEYALYFETGGPVFGDGYTALVRLSGRMLAVKTPTGFELYGVNPGGAAVFGATLNEAYAEFIEATRLVLVDIAAEGAGFSNFRREARSLFAAVGRRTEARWLKPEPGLVEARSTPGSACESSVTTGISASRSNSSRIPRRQPTQLHRNKPLRPSRPEHPGTPN